MLISNVSKHLISEWNLQLDLDCEGWTGRAFLTWPRCLKAAWNCRSLNRTGQFGPWNQVDWVACCQAKKCWSCFEETCFSMFKSRSCFWVQELKNRPKSTTLFRKSRNLTQHRTHLRKTMTKRPSCASSSDPKPPKAPRWVPFSCWQGQVKSCWR